MTTKLFLCTCRYCGATFQRHTSKSTLCDNPECRKKAKAENDKKYANSEKGKATKRRNRNTPKAKETRKRYEQTEAYKTRKHERNKIYRQNPREKEQDKIRKLRYYYRKYSAMRNITKDGADAITPEQFQSFFYKDTCYYCGAKIEGRNKTIDHKTPISRGGTNAIENLCVCCQSCNSKKHNKTEEEYRAVCV